MRKLLFLPLLALIPCLALAQFDFGGTPAKLDTIEFLGNYEVGKVPPGERLDGAYVVLDTLEGRAYLGLPNLSTRPTCSSTEGNGRMVYDTDDDQAFICSDGDWERLDFGTDDATNVDLTNYVTQTDLTNAGYITDTDARTAIVDSLAVVRLPYISRPACNADNRGRIVLDADDDNPYACDGSGWLRIDTDASVYATRTWVENKNYTTATAALSAARGAISDSLSVLAAPEIATLPTCNANNLSRFAWNTTDNMLEVCAYDGTDYEWRQIAYIDDPNIIAANIKDGVIFWDGTSAEIEGTLGYYNDVSFTNPRLNRSGGVWVDATGTSDGRAIRGGSSNDLEYAMQYAWCVGLKELDGVSSVTTATQQAFHYQVGASNLSFLRRSDSDFNDGSTFFILSSSLNRTTITGITCFENF